MFYQPQDIQTALELKAELKERGALIAGENYRVLSIPSQEENAAMKLFRIAVLIFVVVVVASHADETNLTLTVDGITYSNVTFGTVTPLSVSIRHSTGAASIPLEKLPPDLQKRFDYSPLRAAVYRQTQEDQAAQWAERCKNNQKIHGIVVKRLHDGGLLVCEIHIGGATSLIVLDGISGSVGADITGCFVRVDENVALFRTEKDVYGEPKEMSRSVERFGFCYNWSPPKLPPVNDFVRKDAAKLAVWDTK